MTSCCGGTGGIRSLRHVVPSRLPCRVTPTCTSNAHDLLLSLRSLPRASAALRLHVHVHVHAHVHAKFVGLRAAWQARFWRNYPPRLNGLAAQNANAALPKRTLLATNPRDSKMSDLMLGTVCNHSHRQLPPGSERRSPPTRPRPPCTLHPSSRSVTRLTLLPSRFAVTHPTIIINSKYPIHPVLTRIGEGFALGLGMGLGLLCLEILHLTPRRAQ